MNRIIRSICVVTATSLGLGACHKETSNSKASSPASPQSRVDLVSGEPLYPSLAADTWESLGDLSTVEPTITQDVREAFCANAYGVRLMTDVQDFFDFLCTDRKPNEAFDKLDRFAQQVGQSPRAFRHTIAHTPEGETVGFYANAYKVPLSPKVVKKSDLTRYLIRPITFDYAKMTSTVAKNLTDTLGGDLQFGKWHLQTHLDVVSSDGVKFSNDRLTELNLYQLIGGNTDLGLATEHLIDVTNPDYREYRSMILTARNREGGSTILGFMRVAVRNQGYPEVVEKAFADITRIFALHVQSGLMNDVNSGVLVNSN